MIAVLQFDAVSVSVMERMLVNGRLPVLDGLIRRGCRLELDTPARAFAAGAFHSLYSGEALGDHGLYYPFLWSPADQRVRYMHSVPPAPRTAWERIAEAGGRALVIDPYESRPPGKVHGAVVSGVALTDRVVLQGWSVPGEERRRMLRRHGAAPSVEEVFGRPRMKDLRLLRGVLEAGPGRVAAAARERLRGGEYDLAWISFASAHIAGHQFWDRSQVDDAHLDDAERELLDTGLEAVYAAVDRAIGEIVDALPAGADLIVCSPVGMEVNTSRADLLGEMLDAVLAGGTTDPGRGGSPGFLWRLRGAVPRSVRAGVARAMPDALAREVACRLDSRGIDWGQTEAFALPADAQGYVRLNLRGREREGIVGPEAVGELVSRIESGLATFDDIGGGPAVKRVVRTAHAYPGARSGALPDLIIEWSDAPATRLEGVVSPELGEVRRHGGASGRAGNHPPDGAWAVLVPGEGGAVAEVDVARIEDVAATAVSLCGGDMAGIARRSMIER